MIHPYNLGTSVLAIEVSFPQKRVCWPSLGLQPCGLSFSKLNDALAIPSVSQCSILTSEMCCNCLNDPRDVLAAAINKNMTRASRRNMTLIDVAWCLKTVAYGPDKANKIDYTISEITWS